MGLSVISLTAVTVLGMMLYKKIQDEKKKPTVQIEGNSMYLEYSSMLDELKKQKEILNQKELLLDRQSDRINKLELELQVARKQLEKLQDETAVNITQMEENEKRNLRKLAKVYSSMDPEQAATIIARLDDDTIANILILMKERQAAKLLGSFGDQNAESKQRAALISKKIRTMVLSTSVQ
jgi:flagellar motility protein MotE (MotC chaperone)